MATMNLEAILDRVQDLKQENLEKDEVIRAQQGQIDELETKIRQIEARGEELEQKISEMGENAGKAEELVEKLSRMLG